MIQLPVNQKAPLDYEMLDRYDAGISLLGFEVKSLKLGRGNLAGAFVLVRGGEAYLVNTEIPPYQAGNTPLGYDPSRPRKLLLNRRELDTLAGAAKTRGLTLVPIRFYTKGPRIKLEFALARRKKGKDKRAIIRSREAKRTIERALKHSGQ